VKTLRISAVVPCNSNESGICFGAAPAKVLYGGQGFRPQGSTSKQKHLFKMIYTHLKMVFGKVQKQFCPSKVLGAFCPGKVLGVFQSEDNCPPANLSGRQPGFGFLKSQKPNRF
jgi:hypothetical protein